MADEGAWWIPLVPRPLSCGFLAEEAANAQDRLGNPGWPVLVTPDGDEIVGFSPEMARAFGSHEFVAARDQAFLEARRAGR
jgi:hypothetical protein